jgi:hypothetical protein
MRIEETSTQCPHQAGAAITAGTAADAEDDVLCPVVQSQPQQFADAEGGRLHRVETGGCQQRQSCRGRHFDHGKAAVSGVKQGGIDGVAKRPAHAAGNAFHVHAGAEDLKQAIATIGNRHLYHLGSRRRQANTRRHGLRSGHSAETAFQCVGGNNDLQTARRLLVDRWGKRWQFPCRLLLDHVNQYVTFISRDIPWAWQVPGARKWCATATQVRWKPCPALV